MLQKGGIGGAQRAHFLRGFVQFLEKDGKQKGAGVVVGAVAVLIPWHGETRVLQHAGSVGHADQMIEAPRGQVGVLAQVRGALRSLAAVGLEMHAGLVENAGVFAGHMAPDHVASGEVGLFAQRVEARFVVEQRRHLVRDGPRVAEGHDDPASVAEQFDRVPIGRGDDRFPRAVAIGERSRGDLRLVQVGRDVDVGRADVFAEFRVRDVAVDEKDIFFHPEAAGEAFELQTVVLAALAEEVRMRGAEDNVDEARVLFDDFRQRLDDVLDAFVRRKQSEGQHDRAPGDVEMVFVKTRIRESHVGNAVRDEGDLFLRIAVNLAQHAARALGHDDNARGHVDQFLEDAALVLVGFFQHGMQGGDDGHTRAAEKSEQMAAGRAAEDTELVLNAKRVDVGEVEKVGRADVGRHIGLGDLEADIVRIVVFPGPVGNGDDRTTPTRVGLGHGIAQVAREGGDATLARRVVAEEGDFAHGGGIWHSIHCGRCGPQANENFPYRKTEVDHDGIAMPARGSIMVP